MACVVETQPIHHPDRRHHGCEVVASAALRRCRRSVVQRGIECRAGSHLVSIAGLALRAGGIPALINVFTLVPDGAGTLNSQLQSSLCVIEEPAGRGAVDQTARLWGAPISMEGELLVASFDGSQYHRAQVGNAVDSRSEYTQVERVAGGPGAQLKALPGVIPDRWWIERWQWGGWRTASIQLDGQAKRGRWRRSANP